MPKTPSEEELKDFFGNMPENIEKFLDMLQPQAIPGSLYEHMVKQAAPYSVRGVLWYQGESDDVPGRNKLYKDMLAGLISDWRILWGDETISFLIVQLPGFEKWMMNATKNQYSIIRSCQQYVTDTVKNTYLCSISDLGEEMDIHPKNKKDVGNRLALLARGHVYGEALEEQVNIQFAQTSWYIVNLYNQAGIPAIPFELSLAS